MGGTGSTRRVVVEDVDGSGVVKISDNVVRRIRGEEESQPSSSPPSPPSPPPSSPLPLPPQPVSSSSTPPQASAPGPKAKPKPCGKKAEGTQDLEAFYMGRLKQLEERNAELQKITNEQFVRAVQEVEEKFLKHTCSPVCQDLQAKVYECYLGNSKQTLNCSAEVRAFSTCVERARQNALLRKS